MKSLNTQGFDLIRGVFTWKELDVLREEADRVALAEGSACVRHLRAKSKIFDDLATAGRLRELLPEGMFPVRSILFDKTSKENWPVAWHQDLTIAVKERVEVDGYGPWSTKDGSVHVQPPAKLLREMVTIRSLFAPVRRGTCCSCPLSSSMRREDRKFREEGESFTLNTLLPAVWTNDCRGGNPPQANPPRPSNDRNAGASPKTCPSLSGLLSSVSNDYFYAGSRL